MKKSIILILIIVSLFIAGCEKAKNNSDSQIANPASVNCIEQDGTLEIRTNEDGSQTGYCIFDDETECEEWAFYKGECKE